MDNIYQQYLYHAIKTAKCAGEYIRQIYLQKQHAEFKLKEDNSPVTEADLVASKIIITKLSVVTPNIPILSEEASDIPFHVRNSWQKYWLVDPLDGTTEFLKRTGQFTVNIALIENCRPVIGVSFVPITGACYYASRGKGAFRSYANNTVSLNTSSIKGGLVKIISSRTLNLTDLQPMLQRLASYRLIYFGSSLKMCKIAEGWADLYPRFGANCEWDTAAGQCIVEEAGGIVVDFDFQPLQYNTKDSLENPNFLVIGDPRTLTKGFLLGQ